MLSADGQAIVSGSYVAVVDGAAAFVAPDSLTGTVVIDGSTSVFPLMERLAEAFQDLTDVRVEVHSTGSGGGITAAIDGTADIGMSSRAIRVTELERGISSITLAYDGIAVIVNNSNPITNLTMSQVHDIFVRNFVRWSDAQ